MKQQYAVVVLFALIIASGMVSLTSYKTTEKLVTEDMNQALAKTLDEQQSDVISADTIQVFNKHLQMEALRGRAVLAVDTEREFRPRPQVSTATILSLSDQRPAMVLWSIALLWGLFCMYQHRRKMTLGLYGGLALQNGRFVNAKGCEVKFTPMQQQLMDYAAATDGNVVAIAFASVVESRDLRCPLAQETRCQRDVIHAHPTTEAHHRRTFRPQNRVRQG